MINPHGYARPDFSPKLEDYFTDLIENPSIPGYSPSIDARYRLAMESGYAVFWIICEALLYIYKGVISDIPHYTDIQLGIGYTQNLLRNGKIKVKLGTGQFTMRHYIEPKDHEQFMHDAYALLETRKQDGIQKQKENFIDPFHGLFEMLHHDVNLSLPDQPFWDEIILSNSSPEDSLLVNE